MSPRILLVEDEPDNAHIASVACRSAGHTVVHALNGRDALEALEKDPFDLVLVDLLMPEMDGIEFTRRVRADDRFKGLPIIGVTAVVQPEVLDQLWAAGMTQLVVKPYRIHTLREVIRLVAAGEG
jgi:CheY-like chemotaxis protein